MKHHPQYQITTQLELRKAFWAEFPKLSRKRVKDFYGHGTMYTADTRMAFVDWVDQLARDGTIPSRLAQRSTLD